MNYIQFISIGIEVIITILFLIVSLRNNKSHFLGITLSFGIYVFYDLARALSWKIDTSVITIIFLIATLGALFTSWKLYKKND